MRILIKLLTALSALLIGTMASGQDDATLTVFGEGATKDEATTNALRSAIEQAYGVFVSADTKILNDELVKDEIATISTGNIKSYKELSQVKTHDGMYNVSLSAVVSIQNLIKYSESHGSSAEFAGQLFSFNFRMRELNKKNEMIALRNMIEQLRSIQNDIFDYNIVEVKEPQFVSGGNYSVSVTVDITTNPNYENFIKTISTTLASISLTRDEIQNYYSNNMSFRLFMPYYIDVPRGRDPFCNKNVTTIYDNSPNSFFFFLRSNFTDLIYIAKQVCNIYNNAQRSFSIHSKDDSHKEWSPSENEINNITTKWRIGNTFLPGYGDQNVADTTLYLAPVYFRGQQEENFKIYGVTTTIDEEIIQRITDKDITRFIREYGVATRFNDIIRIADKDISHFIKMHGVRAYEEKITHGITDEDITRFGTDGEPKDIGFTKDLHYYSLKLNYTSEKNNKSRLWNFLNQIPLWVPLSIPLDPGRLTATITIPFQYDLETLSSLKGFDVVRKSID